VRDVLQTLNDLLDIVSIVMIESYHVLEGGTNNFAISFGTTNYGPDPALFT